MKKNGVAVVIRTTDDCYYPDYQYCLEELVEASEYFELLEKYRKMKRTIARMKRRNRKKMQKV